MQIQSIKRRVIRIAAISTIAAALLAPGSIASAMQREAGLTACDADPCAVVTLHDLAAKRATQQAQPHLPWSHNEIGFTE